MTTTPVPRLIQGTAALALLAATVAGCTGAGGESSSESAGATDAAAPAAGQAGDALRSTTQRDVAGIGDDAAQATQANQATPLLSRHLIQRASMTVRTERVGEALQEVRVIVAGVQGVVADELTETGRGGEPRSSTLTLRVPAASFDAVLADLGELGRVRSKQVTTQDVSSQVVDVEARVISAERTLQRIRELLEQANDFSDVLSLESELARREADLASLKAQQAYLADQTSLSTISLTLLQPPPVVHQPSDDQPAGFVGGLRVGWDALVGMVTVALTALGVLVPLLLVLAPAAGLVWWGVRRLPRRQAGTTTAESSAG
jgi:Domain of unknown function (DUF4349)